MIEGEKFLLHASSTIFKGVEIIFKGRDERLIEGIVGEEVYNSTLL